MSRSLPYARYEALKVLAADLIEDFGLVYPLQPLEIADRLGVRVRTHGRGLPAIARLCNTDDGYTETAESPHGLKFEIHVDGAKPPMRQRFTIMHEISHVWLDHLLLKRPITPDRAEAEANFTASYLLAPDVLVNAWVPDLAIASIATVFQLSDEAARLAYGRVVRANSRNALGAPHDERILASAMRLVESPLTTDDDLKGSA